MFNDKSRNPHFGRQVAGFIASVVADSRVQSAPEFPTSRHKEDDPTIAGQGPPQPAQDFKIPLDVLQHVEADNRVGLKVFQEGIVLFGNQIQFPDADVADLAKSELKRLQVGGTTVGGQNLRARNSAQPISEIARAAS